MKKKFTTIIILCFSFNFYAQINFVKGSFIDNNDLKKECLIKDEGWKNNPTKFNYKNLEGGVTSVKNIQDVKEFEIENFYKFKRYDVLIDTSATNIDRLSEINKPEWAKKTVFLKIIVEGNPMLYEYVNNGMYRYFYSINDSHVEQLVYKKYYDENNVDIKENKTFQRQLWSNIVCDKITMDRILKLSYDVRDLSKYFTEANNCLGNTIVTNSKNKFDNSSFLFKVKGSGNFNSFSIIRVPKSDLNPDVSFQNSKTYSFGFEIEYFLPFNKKKWTIYFEPTLQSKYKAEKTVVRQYRPVPTEEYWSASYSSLDLALGLRHYFFINDNSKIFINTSLLSAFNLNSNVNVQRNNENLSLHLKPMTLNISFGLGYSYNKASVEFRYNKRNILEDYDGIYTKYKALSIALGYSIFETNKKTNKNPE
ncbi:hypothetical protein [Flavobacterium sp.]|uniref:hypothetical protein n=1 Tax=Flavobacterium sp. TaxID=239 RepID=UPI0038FBED79